MRWSAATLIMLLFAGPIVCAQEEEFSFDAEEFAPRAFELIGFVEAEPEHARANQDGALYQLLFFGREPEEEINRFTGTLELGGLLQKDNVGLHFLTHSEVVWDYLGRDEEHVLYEGYLSMRPEPVFTFDLGKKAVRWGKGYAWNPVAFVERAKDAGDPDLSREGYWIASADMIKRFDGPLQTLAFTPLILPVSAEINEDFGAPGHTNVAGKVYVLYRDMDFDFMFLSNGSRSPRVGMDFSRNLAPQFEIHGEFAYIKDAVHLTLNPDCSRGTPRVEDEVSYLLGTRYRTENDITFIGEYYFNGLGNTKEDQQQFYRCVHLGYETNDADLIYNLPVGRDIDKGPFTRPNPMRRYVNFRVWWDEPGDFLYLTPGLQMLYNLDDNSYSISPDVLYAGYKHLQIRLRATLPVGDRLTEWGEKPNDYKVELRVRYYF